MFPVQFWQFLGRSSPLLKQSGYFLVGLLLSVLLGWLPLAGNSLLAESSLVGVEAAASQPLSEVERLIQQGMAFYQAGQYQSAIAPWQQAVSFYQRQNDRLGQAMVLNHIAQIYVQLKQWDLAQTTLTTSLALLQSNSESQRVRLLRAQAWNTQGSVQLEQGQVKQSIQSWQQAVAGYSQAGQEVGRIGSLINLIQAQQALGLYRSAEQSAQEVKQGLQTLPDSRLKVQALLQLGDMLRRTGHLQAMGNQDESAEAVLASALSLAQRLQAKDLEAAIHFSLANTVRSQVQSSAESKLLATAIEHYRRSQELASDPIVRTRTRLSLFALAVQYGQEVLIQSQFSSLQQDLAQLPLSHAALVARLNFASSWIDLVSTRNWSAQPVLQFLEITQTMTQSLKEPRLESYVLGYQGLLYERLQKWAEARSWTEKALMIAQDLSAPEIVYQWQWQLGKILKQQNLIQPALSAYEGAFKALQSVRQDLVTNDRNDELQFSFQEQIEPFYRQYLDLLVPATSTATAKTNQKQLEQARQVLESLRVAELTDFFRSNCLNRVEVDEIDQSSVAVIYPIVLPDRIAVILSLPQSASSNTAIDTATFSAKQLLTYSTPISEKSLESLVENLRQELGKPYTSPKGKAYSQQLYNLLIRPLEADLTQTSVKTLVFVLDGVLRSIPMAALYNGQQYLVERYNLGLAPGLQLVSPKAIHHEQLNALLLGLTRSRQGFAELANVSPELQAIQQILPSQVLLDEQFTRQNVQARIEKTAFSIVHLATHGQFGSSFENTFVLTWNDRININELRKLLQAQQRNQVEPIELLVLSACKTAVGDKRAALGLAGVAVQAGARSTLASLWSVDDQSSELLIRRFYQALVDQKMTRAEALRQAQLSLLKDPDYRHPRYWAPYLMVGNWL